MEIPIAYEDEFLLAINKPPGIVVNRAQSVQGETVQDWAIEKLHISNYKFQFEVTAESEKETDYQSPAYIEREFVKRAGIAHRIDKETSGILLIAKTPEVFSQLQGQFRERALHKTYVAIAHGVVEPQRGEIKAPVGRLPWNKERFGIVPGGKDSITKFHVLASGFLVGDQKSSLLELHPETGRTHQIRVHLKYINHPILGDYLYAGRKTSRGDRAVVARVMLHAWKMSLTHPQTGDTLDLVAPIPDDMSTVLKDAGVVVSL
jgi:23S rRNA pseudouridine1911/1915/1917 synthase